MRTNAIEARQVEYRYGEREVLRKLNFVVAPAELVAVVGPNGAGKSTLLRTLLRLVPFQHGEVTLFGQSLVGLARKEIAKKAAFVPQSAPLDIPFDVFGVIAMGRAPYRSRFAPLDEYDRSVIAHAAQATQVTSLLARPFAKLSVGERQRVLLARALAQSTPLLVLDEPNASLDLAHAFDVLRMIRKYTLDGASALVAIHDLNLAAQFSDRMLVLHEGQLMMSGTPREVLTEEMLSQVFGLRAKVMHDGVPHVLVRE